MTRMIAVTKLSPSTGWRVTRWPGPGIASLPMLPMMEPRPGPEPECRSRNLKEFKRGAAADRDSPALA